MFQVDGQTDEQAEMTKLIVAFRNFVNTPNKHKRRTSMTLAGFEPAIPAIKQLQTYALHRTVTGIGIVYMSMVKIMVGFIIIIIIIVIVGTFQSETKIKLGFPLSSPMLH